ncbi:MAG TPA: nucleoside monophosphate kinase [Malonomonas sp.]
MAITPNLNSPASLPHMLIVIGKPGAGKSTLTHRLSRELGLRLIAIGNIARVEAAEGTDLGNQVRPYLLNMLLPAKLVGEILARELADPRVRETGFLLDWTPRSLDDLQNLCSIFAHYQLRSNLTVIYVRVSDAVVKQRILQHRAVLEKRVSDTEEIVDERLRQFAETAPPILARIRQNGLKYREIDGEQEHEAAYRSLLACLEPGTATEQSRQQSADCRRIKI